MPFRYAFKMLISSDYFFADAKVLMLRYAFTPGWCRGHWCREVDMLSLTLLIILFITLLSLMLADADADWCFRLRWLCFISMPADFAFAADFLMMLIVFAFDSWLAEARRWCADIYWCFDVTFRLPPIIFSCRSAVASIADFFAGFLSFISSLDAFIFVLMTWRFYADFIADYYCADDDELSPCRCAFISFFSHWCTDWCADYRFIFAIFFISFHCRSADVYFISSS